MRNEHLAHRQPTQANATGATATDEEIERFYQDSSKLIQILLSIAHSMAYDPQDAARVFAVYASHFWNRVTKQPSDVQAGILT